MLRKTHLLGLSVLAIIMLTTTTVSYSQGWGEILLGVGSALLENHIDKSSNYSSQEKESMKNNLNTINNAVNTNQNARNATREASQGNYTGAVIQGAQTIMNATGNYQYDTYLNSANQINNANREYKQDIKNGIDQQEALNKRNTTIGYSAAESAIELQDKIAQERAEKIRQQKEAERQLQDSYNYYSEPTYGTTTSADTRVTTSNVKTGSINSPSINANKNSSYNSNPKTLSSVNSVMFLTEEGEYVWLSVPYGEVNSLSFQNHSNKTIRLSCDRACVKVKYMGDDNEHAFTGACSFIMPANSDGKMKWLDIFPGLSNKLSDVYSIQSIKVIFEDTQIKESSNNNSNNNSNSNSNNNNSQLLTKNQIVKYTTNEGTPVALGLRIDDTGTGGYQMFYNNLYNDRKVRFSCNNVSIRIKYVGDEKEQTFSDACSFIMPANTQDYINISDIFFNISETLVIESLKILFVDAQIQ